MANRLRAIAVITAVVGLLVGAAGFSAEGVCLQNLNDGGTESPRWTQTVGIKAVETIKGELALRVTVDPEACNPAGCSRNSVIELRVNASATDARSDFEMMKKIVHAAYTRSIRARFRMALTGGAGDCVAMPGGSIPVADGVSLARKTNS